MKAFFSPLFIACLGLPAACSGGLILTGDPTGDAAMEPEIPEISPEAAEPQTDIDLDEFGCNNPMPANCFEFSNRLWPVATDGGEFCTDSTLTEHPSTGENSADWFLFGNCGSRKEYSTEACTWVWIHSRGDTCDGCVLWHIDYVIEENVENDWVQIESVNPEPDYRGMQHQKCYLTLTGKFRISANSGFYVQVHME